MDIVRPQQETVVSTNLVNAESDWSSGTYNLGDRAVESGQVYEVVADPSTTDQPSVGADADPPTWIVLGYDNKHRLFTGGQDSTSTRAGGIEFVVSYPEVVTHLALLNLRGLDVTVTMDDVSEGEVYSKTVELTDIGVVDWWEFFFLPYESTGSVVFDDLPPYSAAEITVSLTTAEPTDESHIGRVVAGFARELGVTLYGTSVQLQDYSIKERDGFGNLSLKARRTLSIVSFDVIVATPLVSFVVRELKSLSASPALYIGDPSIDAAVVFGVYNDVSQGITNPSVSELTLQVEEF